MRSQKRKKKHVKTKIRKDQRNIKYILEEIFCEDQNDAKASPKNSNTKGVS